MKKTALVLTVAAIVALSACSKPRSSDYSSTEYSSDSKTVMQKRYKGKDECQREFPQEGDCVRYTTASGGHGYISPFFYPWGGIYHSNGTMSYNQRVPTSGYYSAPPSTQSLVQSRTNFSNVPRSYSSRMAGNSTRGGFGASSRGSSAS